MGIRGKTIVIGVCGGIAAYKVCAVASGLVKLGATVHVMMTKNATQFVTPLTFETLSHNRVTVDTFNRDFTWEVEHVSLAKRADAVLIAPATANIIAKLACGIADDFVTTTVLACTCPVLFAPAMNTAMLDAVVTQKNISTLVSRGFVPVYGEEGRLACGDSGRGRMAEPDVLISEIQKFFASKNDLAGKTVLVTAGATKCMLDPVRYITNRSSGKMGYGVATAAYERGANVVFVKGATNSFNIPTDWTVEEASTTQDMLAAVQKHSSADIFVMAAAPCDYSVDAAPQKIKAGQLDISLKKAPDIAAWVGKNKKAGAVMAVFAAETQDHMQNAQKKLLQKNADLVVLNDVTAPGAGFDVDTNIVTLISRTDSTALGIMEKREIADIILDKLTQ